MAPEINNGLNSNQLKNSSNFMASMTPTRPFETTQTVTSVPPPLPPRSHAQNYSGYNNIYRPYNSSYFGNYGYGGYRNYGGFDIPGNYMPYSNMSTYNNYSQITGSNIENRFQQYAEENTRSTFHLIETVLHTFSSITTILESTYFALTNSFRAILSVADNIGKLRSTVGQLLSTLALIRFLKWIYKQVLHILGLRKQEAINDDLWQQSISQVANNTQQKPITTSTWTNFLLIAAISIIPYLIHKISTNARQIQIQINNPSNWLKCTDPVYVATVMYNFSTTSAEELNLKIGQKLWLAPRSLQLKNTPGWLLATDSKNVGLIPANYINVTGILKKPEDDENITTSMQIPTSTQDATSLKEETVK